MPTDLRLESELDLDGHYSINDFLCQSSNIASLNEAILLGRPSFSVVLEYDTYMGTKLYDKNREDLATEALLRPSLWDDYVGQDKVKSNVRLIMDAAKQRGEACDHLLFYGQAGLG